MCVVVVDEMVVRDAESCGDGSEDVKLRVVARLHPARIHQKEMVDNVGGKKGRGRTQ